MPTKKPAKIPKRRARQVTHDTSTHDPKTGKRLSTPTAADLAMVRKARAARLADFSPAERKRLAALAKEGLGTVIEQVGARVHDIAGHGAFNRIQNKGTTFADCKTSICVDLQNVIARLREAAPKGEPRDHDEHGHA